MRPAIRRSLIEAGFLATAFTAAALAPSDTVRAANVILAAIAGLGLAVRTNDIWSNLTTGRRVSYIGVIVVLIANAYGSAEAYVQGARTGIRGPILLAAYLLVIVGLWRSHSTARAARRSP